MVRSLAGLASTTSPTATAPSPLRVVLIDLERLAPPELDSATRLAWLEAPIGLEPLYRVLLEPLVGLGAVALELAGGDVAADLGRLVGRKPCFGLDALVRPFAPRTGESGVTLLLPGLGPLDADLAGLVERVRCAAPSRVVAVAELAGANTGAWALPVAALKAIPARLPSPRGWFEDGMPSLGGGGAWRVSGAPAGKIFPTGSSRGLRAAARARLEGSLRRESAGFVRGRVWIGARATVSSRAICHGPAAVGDESHVASGATLGEFVTIGRGCYVGSGAFLEDVVLLDGTVVEPGERVVGQVRLHDRMLG